MVVVASVVVVGVVVVRRSLSLFVEVRISLFRVFEKKKSELMEKYPMPGRKFVPGIRIRKS